VLVRDGSGRCSAHQREAWGKRADVPERIRGRRGQALRQELFRRQPLCVECERQGRVSLAVVRDHIVPLAEGGKDTEDNAQGLCNPCHDEKSLGERLRAQRRSRGAA
jgi:5-methylcytosine-specific restriction enzyme A